MLGAVGIDQTCIGTGGREEPAVEIIQRRRLDELGIAFGVDKKQPIDSQVLFLAVDLCLEARPQVEQAALSRYDSVSISA